MTKTTKRATAHLAALVDELPNLITGLDQEIQSITETMARLKRQGLVYASPFWKRDKSGQPKYFYLLHTQRKGEPRNREYIGCDANRIARANAAIERAKQYDDLNQRLTQLQSQAEQGVRVLADAKRVLAGNGRPW
ncbi:hypothetical protein BRM19_22080 [Xanthomonas oryzae pv. oryzae]|uniref:hypothetical protein n=1 Tax=Xanthomonas oryzae TaxID=347 RepID=UPI000DE1773E|nr:hypothetical protein [Xanthomonas oryzae]RBD68929.1 hypothetical protein BRM19_22080 [Xanthomonas oryzae pv. oryzae]